jgi:hypothetical protein
LVTRSAKSITTARSTMFGPRSSSLSLKNKVYHTTQAALPAKRRKERNQITEDFYFECVNKQHTRTREN